MSCGYIYIEDRTLNVNNVPRERERTLNVNNVPREREVIERGVGVQCLVSIYIYREDFKRK